MPEQTARAEPTLGALGGPHTFGGQAAQALVRRYPRLGHVAFVASSPELFADDGRWRVDAACVPAFTSRTGPHLNTHRRLVRRDELFVVAEDRHSYHCALLALPGTRIGSIRRVLGHTGSVSQSRQWLAEHAPQAEITIVDSHSLGAAREVLASRGDIAAVGSTDLAAETGLEILARDIDGGSVGFYWALSGTPHRDPRPDRVVVSGRVRDGGGLSDLVCGLHGAGYRLVSLSQTPSGEGLFHDGAVAYFSGEGTLDAVRDAVRRVAGMRLAGAYTTTPAAP